MAMQKSVKICKEEDSEPILLPLNEDDGSLALSCLKSFFPEATGLRYYASDCAVHDVKLSDGKFHPPDNGWGNSIYYCILSAEDYLPSVETSDIDIDEFDLDLVKNEPETEVIEFEFSDDGSHSSTPHKSNQNIKTPSAGRPYRCDLCGNCFTQQSHMLRHRRIHTGEKPFVCDQCQERFSRSDKLKLHYDRCHSAPAPTLLRDKREKKPKVLDSDFEWNTISGSSFKSKNLTVRFKKSSSVELDKDEYYSVVNMAEVEMNDDNADCKKETESNEERKAFVCTVCDKSFAKKNQLQRHVRIHTGERPFSCQTCAKSFTRIDALKRHLASVGHQKQKEINANSEVNEYEMNGLSDPTVSNDDNDVETNCDIASFAQVTYNLENIRAEEPEESRPTRRRGKENFCYQCNHLFTNRFNYNRHMKSHEKEEKSFKCTYCQYVFRRQSHLTRHVLIHTGEKPFQCSFCEERFSRSDKLKLHIKRTHSL